MDTHNLRLHKNYLRMRKHGHKEFTHTQMCRRYAQMKCTCAQEVTEYLTHAQTWRTHAQVTHTHAQEGNEYVHG